MAVDLAARILWSNRGWNDLVGERTTATTRRPRRSYFASVPPASHEPLCAGFERALADESPFEHDCELPSSGERRKFHVRALPVRGKGLLLEHTLVVDVPRDGPAVHEVGSHIGADGLVRQCVHCRRVRRAEGKTWDWIPAWAPSPPGRTSHSLCKACRAFYWRT